MINICFEQGDKHKVCGRMKNMKKIALAIAATSILGVSASTQAAVDVAYRDWETDRKSTRLNSSHITRSRMPSSA